MRKIFVLLTSALCLAVRGWSQVVMQQPASQTVVHGASATFSVAVSGAGPFGYQWQHNGTNLPIEDIITTIAGNGCAYIGEGLATNFGVGLTEGLRCDANGNVFIVDGSDNRVLVVWTNGLLQELAGSGPAPNNYGSYSGDGGPATNATFFKPSDLVLNSQGELYIADNLNNRVRKVDTNGIITTFAGGGDGGDGPATNAALGSPGALAVDSSGNLFVGEQGCSICKVDTNGMLTTVAGEGGGYSYSGDGGPAINARFNFDYGVGLAFDSSGDLYIADSFNFRIRKVDTNGIVTTVAGNGVWGFSGDGGPATNAALNLPGAVVVDHTGNLYIADWGNNRIRQVDTNGIITTVAGSGPLWDTNRFSGDGGPATNATLLEPQGVALDHAGNLYISDSYNFRIRKVAFAGSPSITLSNVAPENAGQYQVVVTGPSGSVTSAVATLIVSWPTLFTSASPNPDGTLTLNCASAPNSTNLLLASTNLSSLGPWQVVSTNIAGSDGAWQFTDSTAPSYPARFYRVVSQ